jgi:hypothetical protein
MLELSSKRWAELDHAYGDADDLPTLLPRLREVDEDVLNMVFGSICHQGSVYSASFAAVPHLVHAALAQQDAEFRAQILILVGSVRASTDYRGDTRPAPDILEAYEQVLPEALRSGETTLREPLDKDTAIYLLEAAAALKGFDGPGRVLSGFSGREFAPTCPGCERQLYAWPEAHCLSVTSEDPVSQPGAKRTVTRPGPRPGNEAPFAWLMQLAQTAGLAEVASLLPHLFGDAVCPECGTTFGLIERLGGETL